MLSLQLKSGEYLTIGENIAVQVFQQGGASFRVAVKAPREVPILRGEVLERDGDERPEGLRNRKPRRPTDQARNAKRLDAFAEKKASRKEEEDVLREMRAILSRMDGLAEEVHGGMEAAGMREEVKALLSRLDLLEESK